MIIISDLSYVEVVSASNILGGAAQGSVKSTTTTSTGNSSVKKEVRLKLDLPDPKPTAVDLELEKAFLAL